MTVAKPAKSHAFLAQGEIMEQTKQPLTKQSGKTLNNFLLKNHIKPKSPQRNNNHIERFASL